MTVVTTTMMVTTMMKAVMMTVCPEWHARLTLDGGSGRQDEGRVVGAGGDGAEDVDGEDTDVIAAG